jgi:hypothetical protein
VYPSGRQVTYQYDNAFRLTNVLNNGSPFASNFTYDTSGRLTAYSTGAVGHGIQYDDRDRVRQLTAGPGVAHMDLTYAYDKVSNVRTINDARAGSPATTQTYTYDVLNRMKTAHGPWGGLAWDYDAAGNRQSEVGASTTTYGYDPGTNRLTSTLTGGASPETFTWNSVGQLQTHVRGASTQNYTYSPAGMLLSTSAPNVAATYLYDADHLRVKREVNGMTFVTARSFGGQVLSEYQVPCTGVLQPVRDNVYAGSRLLGAVRWNRPAPTVAITGTASAVSETAAAAQVSVQLSTPDGAPLACPVTVSLPTAPGSAVLGNDYQTTSASIVFDAGAPHGQVKAAAFPLVNDGTSEPSQFFTITLTNVTGGLPGAGTTHHVWIEDDDPLPSLLVSDPVVNENAGVATFTLTLSQATEHGVSINVDAANGTAREHWDYTDIAEVVYFAPTSISRTVSVPVIDDARAEPSETFDIQIWNAVNVTVPDWLGTATIVDNERPRAPIDPSLPGQFIAHGTANPNSPDYIAIGNRHAVTVPARVTFTRWDGSGIAHEFDVPANARVTLRPQDFPSAFGIEDVAIAVQSRNPSYPLDAEHAVYTTWSGWQSGRASEGVTPSPTWYFAEGSVGYFEEVFTIFNPSNGPVDVTATYYGASGVIGQSVHHIEEGPGRTVFWVRDVIGAVDHGTKFEARNLAGALTPVVVERSMTWQASGAFLDENGSPGVPAGQMVWHFAEGDTGLTTYLLLLNPNPDTQNVQVKYLHENGTAYQTDVSMPANSRMTVAPPAWLPAGSFGMRVGSYTGVPIVAERSMYGGTNWTFGHTGVGANALANFWAFSEGATGSFFSTYFLLANPNATQADVWLKFTRTDGGVVWHYVAVPATSRRTIDVNNVPGMSSTEFRTEIISVGLPPSPIVAERATYWPGGGSALMATPPESASLDAALTGATASTSEPGTGAAGVARMFQSVAFSPYGRARPRITLPNFYHSTVEPTPAGELERALADQFQAEELNKAIGTMDAVTGLEPGGGASSLTSSGGWYGAHLTGGRRP